MTLLLLGAVVIPFHRHTVTPDVYTLYVNFLAREVTTSASRLKRRVGGGGGRGSGGRLLVIPRKSAGTRAHGLNAKNHGRKHPA